MSDAAHIPTHDVDYGPENSARPRTTEPANEVRNIYHLRNVLAKAATDLGLSVARISSDDRVGNQIRLILSPRTTLPIYLDNLEYMIRVATTDHGVFNHPEFVRHLSRIVIDHCGSSATPVDG